VLGHFYPAGEIQLGPYLPSGSRNSGNNGCLALWVSDVLIPDFMGNSSPASIPDTVTVVPCDRRHSSIQNLDSQEEKKAWVSNGSGWVGTEEGLAHCTTVHCAPTSWRRYISFCSDTSQFLPVLSLGLALCRQSPLAITQL
jgi:hypothetical protein